MGALRRGTQGADGRRSAVRPSGGPPAHPLGRRPSARLRCFAFAVLFLLVGAGVPALAGDVLELDIVAGDVRHPFKVELAVDAATRGKGLMFRRSLADDAGMLFDFGREIEVSMWMRNTYIPLDMLFADANGVVHRIAERTEPFSEEIIPSGAPTRYVLEVPGGTAARLNLKPGTRLEPVPLAEGG